MLTVCGCECFFCSLSAMNDLYVKQPKCNFCSFELYSNICTLTKQVNDRKRKATPQQQQQQERDVKHFYTAI